MGTAVGLMQEVKVLPQYVFNAIFTALGVVGLKVDTTFWNLFGTTLGLSGAVLYAAASHNSQTKGKLFLGSNGLYRANENQGRGPTLTTATPGEMKVSLHPGHS